MRVYIRFGRTDLVPRSLTGFRPFERGADLGTQRRRPPFAVVAASRSMPTRSAEQELSSSVVSCSIRISSCIPIIGMVSSLFRRRYESTDLQARLGQSVERSFPPAIPEFLNPLNPRFDSSVHFQQIALVFADLGRVAYCRFDEVLV